MKNVLKRFSLLMFSLAIGYFGVLSIGLNQFLDELIFKSIAVVKTHELNRFTVSHENNEVLVRVYGKGKVGCIIFFPGQHGGIARYEDELFNRFTNIGLTVYALSYPGYEGAAGKSTWESVGLLAQKTVDVIDSTEHCQLDEAVFVGRSLGAAIALNVALEKTPKGIVLDGVAPSLFVAVKARMRKNLWLFPAQLLPVERLLEYNLSIKSVLPSLPNQKIVIFQGEYDDVTPYHEIESTIEEFSAVQFHKVPGANHSNAHVLAIDDYLWEIQSLFSPTED